MANEAKVEPGSVLDGKYRIERVLGSGGMGVVVCAHHLLLNDRVALKFLQPHLLERPEVAERFSREARAAVRIKSEHVAKVIDVGYQPESGPYMVMEYLEGEDLSVVLSRQGALAPEQAVEFVLQACEALAEAHALGVVHRDLKPGNMFCVRRADGLLSVKVLDFGISKLGEEGDSVLTKTDATMGSPLYMSPEQMRSPKLVDARSDIWSLGVVLFELLTGEVPFRAQTFAEVVLQVNNDPPPNIGRLAPNLPAGLAAAVQKALQRDVQQRFQSVADLAEAIAPYGPAERAPVSARRTSRILETSAARSSSSGVGSQRSERLLTSEPPRSTTVSRRGSRTLLGVGHPAQLLTTTTPSGPALPFGGEELPPPPFRLSWQRLGVWSVLAFGISAVLLFLLSRGSPPQSLVVGPGPQRSSKAPELSLKASERKMPATTQVDREGSSEEATTGAAAGGQPTSLPPSEPGAAAGSEQPGAGRPLAGNPSPAPNSGPARSLSDPIATESSEPERDDPFDPELGGRL